MFVLNTREINSAKLFKLSLTAALPDFLPVRLFRSSDAMNVFLVSLDVTWRQVFFAANFARESDISMHLVPMISHNAWPHEDHFTIRTLNARRFHVGG